MIDHTGFQLETRKVLIEGELNCTIETATTLEGVYIAFHKNVFDIVVIDHSIENGEQCIEYILQTDPKQPVLVVSNAIRCVVKRCHDCVNEHHIRRLFNPTPIHNIIRILERFEMYECDHYDAETDRL